MRGRARALRALSVVGSGGGVATESPIIVGVVVVALPFPFVRPRESHSKTRLSSDKEDGDGRDGGERRPSALFRIFRLLSDDDAVAADQNSIRPLLTMTPTPTPPVLRPPTELFSPEISFRAF